MGWFEFGTAAIRVKRHKWPGLRGVDPATPSPPVPPTSRCPRARCPRRVVHSGGQRDAAAARGRRVCRARHLLFQGRWYQEPADGDYFLAFFSQWPLSYTSVFAGVGSVRSSSGSGIGATTYDILEAPESGVTLSILRHEVGQIPGRERYLIL